MNVGLQPYVAKDGKQKFQTGTIYFPFDWMIMYVAQHPEPFWFAIDSHVKGEWPGRTTAAMRAANEHVIEQNNGSVISLWNVPCLGGMFMITTEITKEEDGETTYETSVEPLGGTED